MANRPRPRGDMRLIKARGSPVLCSYSPYASPQKKYNRMHNCSSRTTTRFGLVESTRHQDHPRYQDNPRYQDINGSRDPERSFAKDNASFGKLWQAFYVSKYGCLASKPSRAHAEPSPLREVTGNYIPVKYYKKYFEPQDTSPIALQVTTRRAGQHKPLVPGLVVTICRLLKYARDPRERERERATAPGCQGNPTPKG
jgi:hypothetical protein